MKLLLFSLLVTVCYSFDFDCLKGPEYWCSNNVNAKKCNKITECFKYNKYNKNINPVESTNEKDLACELCIKFISYFKENVLNQTKQEFINFLNNKICNLLDNEVQNICKTFISEYGTIIYDYIKNIDPKVVCDFLSVCSSKGKHKNLMKPLKQIKFGSCATCKEYFQILESLFSKITLSDFKYFLKMLCKKIPNESFHTCELLVDGFGSQFYELIKTFLDDNRICPLIHLCPDNFIDNKIEDLNCQTCLNSIVALRQDLINEMKSKNETDIKSFICSKYIFPGLCDNSQSSLKVTFMKDIRSNLSPEAVCMKNKICNLFKQSNEKMKIKNMKCETCHFVILKIKMFISDPNEQANMKKFLKNDLCRIFQEKKIQCQQLIDEFFNIVLNVVIAEFDIDRICKFIRMCPSGVKAEPECVICQSLIDKIVNLVTSVSGQRVISEVLISEICDCMNNLKTECVQLVDLYLPILMSIVKSSLNSKFICSQFHFCNKLHATLKIVNKNSIECEICLFSIKETGQFLKNPTVEAAIKNVIKTKICIYFATEAECKTIMNQYFSIFINSIVEFLNPSLCTKLELCHLPNSTTRIKQYSSKLIKWKKLTFPDCLLCVKFYVYVQKIIDSNKNINIAMNSKKFCNRMQQPMNYQCLKQLKNFDAVVEAFKKSKNIVEFCQITKMCSNHTATPNDRLKLCILGPQFWCISINHATACGPGALKYCQMNIFRPQSIL